jgi:hypothetical protein
MFSAGGVCFFVWVKEEEDRVFGLDKNPNNRELP